MQKLEVHVLYNYLHIMCTSFEEFQIHFLFIVKFMFVRKVFSFIL